MATASMIEQAVQAAEMKARANGAEVRCWGWPHLDAKGNCLCTRPCCIGRDGCQCKQCTHASHS